MTTAGIPDSTTPLFSDAHLNATPPMERETALPSACLSDASRKGHTFPPETIPGMSAIGPARRLAPMREENRIDNLATIETSLSLELEAARIVSKINEAVCNHHPLTTLATHSSPPSSFDLILCA